jgi:hypothetical protein
MREYDFDFIHSENRPGLKINQMVSFKSDRMKKHSRASMWSGSKGSEETLLDIWRKTRCKSFPGIARYAELLVIVADGGIIRGGASWIRPAGEADGLVQAGQSGVVEESAYERKI